MTTHIKPDWQNKKFFQLGNRAYGSWHPGDWITALEYESGDAQVKHR